MDDKTNDKSNDEANDVRSGNSVLRRDAMSSHDYLSRMQVNIVNQSGQSVSRTFILDWLQRLGELAAKKINPKRYRDRELTVVFLATEAARKLNQQYRKRDYATDVLSFQGMDDETLGDLVICLEVIKRQAKEHGLTVNEELGYMILHGFLHLLGYDHEVNERDAKKMFKLQDELFEALLAKRPEKSSPKRKPKGSSELIQKSNPISKSKSTDSHKKAEKAKAKAPASARRKSRAKAGAKVGAKTKSSARKRSKP